MVKTKHKKLTQIFDDTPVWGAVIFGSTAKNETDFISDIDIMTFSDEPLSYNEYMNLYMSLTDTLNRDVDLVDFTTAKNPLLKSVRRNHRILYGNKEDILHKLNTEITDEKAYIKDKSDIPNSQI